MLLLQLWSNKVFRYAVLILVVVAIVFLVGKSMGKKSQEKKQVKLPDSGNGIPKGWDPRPLANEVFKNFKGVFTFASVKEVTLGKVFSLSDDQLVALYNTFNREFSDNGDTLTKWLRDEYNVAVGGVRDAVVDRLLKLNCL